MTETALITGQKAEIVEEPQENSPHPREYQTLPIKESGQVNSSETTASLRLYASMFQGPLPSPEILAAYKNVAPEVLEHVLSEAKHQSEHRRKIESQFALSHTTLGSRGLWSALVIAVLLVCLAAWVAYLGHPYPAVAIVGGDLVALVMAFIHGARGISKHETRDKRLPEVGKPSRPPQHEEKKLDIRRESAG